MSISTARIRAIFRRASEVQTRHDGTTPEPLKVAAKQVCTDKLCGVLPPGSAILDVGGEEFYHPQLADFDVTTANLPGQDMHELAYRGEFDAAIAMHVIEHSPFPLYVLELIHAALKVDG